MFLKNYTSDVPASDSIRRIEQVLLRCGVKNISKEYGLNQKIVAITFTIESDGKPWTIRLPADEKRAIDALFLDYADGAHLSPDGQRISDWRSRKKLGRRDFVAQGERTAWRIVKDWIEIQMSMIQLKQADFMEVFLPYAWDGKRTYYQMLRESNYAGLLTESSVIEAEVVK